MQQEIKLKHIGSLIGRLFLIIQPSGFANWKGSKEDEQGENDYDLLEDFISYEEGDLTSFSKPPGVISYLFYSMSTKIELFVKENGFIICDGLYFNESWNYSDKLSFRMIEKTSLKINVLENCLIIVDAASEGNKLSEIQENGVYNNNLDLFVLINLDNGIYEVHKVETNILVDGKNVVLKGIEINAKKA